MLIGITEEKQEMNDVKEKEGSCQYSALEKAVGIGFSLLVEALEVEIAYMLCYHRKEG